MEQKARAKTRGARARRRTEYESILIRQASYPTDQACHVGDYVAGRVGTLHSRACQLFPEISLRVSSSVSSSCILHLSTFNSFYIYIQ